MHLEEFQHFRLTISLFSFLFYSFLLCDRITPPDHSKAGSVLSEPVLFLSKFFEHPFFDRDLARPLNHAGGSPCPGISFLHRLVGHASCVSNTPCPGGNIFAEPQRRFRRLRTTNQGAALITCKFSEENLTKDFYPRLPSAYSPNTCFTFSCSNCLL